MVVTILTAAVPKNKISLLQKRYAAIVNTKPVSLVKTYLLVDSTDRVSCKIISVWKSMEDLLQMKKQGTPTGVLLFREFGVEPVLTVFDVAGESA